MPPRIEELAEHINTNTQKVSQYLESHSLPQPSFDEDGPVDLQINSQEVDNARREAINNCYELLDLLQGPKALVRPVANATSAQAIHRYDIPAKVPLGREISFKDLAEKCGLHEPDLRRIIRFAITYHRLFQEKRDGFVSHSATSRWLAENPVAMDGVGLIHDTFYRSFAWTVDALQQFDDQEPNQTGFCLAHNTDEGLFSYLASRPEDAKRFGGAMKSFTADIPGNSPSFLINGYPWESLGPATVVDVGGSQAQIAIMLAEAFPKLNLIVMDLPDVLRHAQVPEHLSNRIQLHGHDFFEKQSTVADVYFFRWIFHDWPDKYMIKILRQLVPVLRPGARIIVNDSICPGPNTVPYDVERTIRGVDMVMLSLHNSREREKGEWEPLFKAADPRFGALKFYHPQGASLSIIESIWQA
ncbi:O-methyltransferas-like protein [Massariosphaeria phaeospora]|uniref:O-methyltransferas-like protein n=1 Tax=Massariosphaeria phaeospora TaxID=100035 RepID=A0A7C8MAL2_9PLEO|nr:O-methyltransferas-like protein [Massariosphaeria phaeospora]